MVELETRLANNWKTRLFMFSAEDEVMIAKPNLVLLGSKMKGWMAGNCGVCATCGASELLSGLTY